MSSGYSNLMEPREDISYHQVIGRFGQVPMDGICVEGGYFLGERLNMVVWVD